MTPENQGSAVCRLTGEVNVPSGATVRMQPWNSIRMEIASELTGSGDFWVYGRIGTSNMSGSLELLGLNTNFFGRIGVNELVQPSKDSPRMDRYYQTLYLNDPRNLGGRLETFDPYARVRRRDGADRGMHARRLHGEAGML